MNQQTDEVQQYFFIFNKQKRPETQKCSRLDKRRLASQSQQGTYRIKAIQPEFQTSSNFYTDNYKGMTLEQYFKGGNFQVVEIKEEEWDHEPPPKNNNFRIKRSSKQQSRGAASLGTKQPFKSKLQTTKDQLYLKNDLYNESKFLPQKVLNTSKDFFRQPQEQEIMRRTQIDEKYLNLKNEINQRFQNEDEQLINKYAHKFNIFPDLNQPRTNLRLKEIYSKLK